MLGGGGGPRDLGVQLTTDMEQIDPAAVQLPALVPRRTRARAATWRSSLFTGEGERTRMSRITNRRWVTVGVGHAPRRPA